jgi:hypothetical protein
MKPDISIAHCSTFRPHAFVHPFVSTSDSTLMSGSPRPCWLWLPLSPIQIRSYKFLNTLLWSYGLLVVNWSTFIMKFQNFFCNASLVLVREEICDPFPWSDNVRPRLRQGNNSIGDENCQYAVYLATRCSPYFSRNSTLVVLVDYGVLDASPALLGNMLSTSPCAGFALFCPTNSDSVELLW